jgi:transcriptional regulator with XRE-family HTH domain
LENLTLPLSTFGQRLEEVRHILRMNKTDFGKALDITPSSLTRYENNTVQPSLDFFERLAMSSHISGVAINLNWLISGVGEIIIETKSIDKEDQNIPEYTNYLFTKALIFTLKNNSYKQLDHLLEQFILREEFKDRFTFPQSAAFFSEAFVYLGNIKFLRLFVLALAHHKSTIPNIFPDFSNEILQTHIATFQLGRTNDSPYFISEKQRKCLSSLLDQLSNIECFVILSDVDKAIEILENASFFSDDLLKFMQEKATEIEFE